MVEVEYYNTKGLKAPSEDFITQEVKQMSLENLVLLCLLLAGGDFQL